MTKVITNDEPSYNYFSAVITDYEAEYGEIEKLIRDTRGVYVAPHGGELTPMGTITVSVFSRPPWSYSNILFLEKEDLVSALRQSGFLDRWDCFAMSSKGFSSRAARDLIDKIGAQCKEEPTKFFSVHDADASGSLISQTLIKATKARGARLVEVIDLGLFPWSALAEGLLRERAERKSNKKRPVADYIRARDQANQSSGNPDREPNWETWLQDWRIELNAMTTAEFVAWMQNPGHSAHRDRRPTRYCSERHHPRPHIAAVGPSAWGARLSMAARIGKGQAVDRSGRGVLGDLEKPLRIEYLVHPWIRQSLLHASLRLQKVVEITALAWG